MQQTLNRPTVIFYIIGRLFPVLGYHGAASPQWVCPLGLDPHWGQWGTSVPIVSIDPDPDPPPFPPLNLQTRLYAAGLGAFQLIGLLRRM